MGGFDETVFDDSLPYLAKHFGAFIDFYALVIFSRIRWCVLSSGVVDTHTHANPGSHPTVYAYVCGVIVSAYLEIVPALVVGLHSKLVVGAMRQGFFSRHADPCALAFIQQPTLGNLEDLFTSLLSQEDDLPHVIRQGTFTLEVGSTAVISTGSGQYGISFEGFDEGFLKYDPSVLPLRYTIQYRCAVKRTLAVRFFHDAYTSGQLDTTDRESVCRARDKFEMLSEELGLTDAIQLAALDVSSFLYVSMMSSY